MIGNHSKTRQRILQAALKRFAHAGYAATSVQQIVDDARVSKPALYYHFGDKAGLFRALLDTANDDRYRLMQEAAARAGNARDRLIEVLAELFEHVQRNRELVRMAFASLFAAPGELPRPSRHDEKCERNFDFIHSLMKQGQATGELDARFDSRELALGFFGQMNIYTITHLMLPKRGLGRQTAVRVVSLFLAGACKGGGNIRKKRS